MKYAYVITSSAIHPNYKSEGIAGVYVYKNTAQEALKKLEAENKNTIYSIVKTKIDFSIKVI